MNNSLLIHDMTRCAKIILLCSLILASAICVIKLSCCVWAELIQVNDEVDVWLEQNHLSKYKQLFKDKGMNLFAILVAF